MFALPCSTLIVAWKNMLVVKNIFACFQVDVLHYCPCHNLQCYQVCSCIAKGLSRVFFPCKTRYFPRSVCDVRTQTLDFLAFFCSDFFCLKKIPLRDLPLQN
jgi:hypothetical protein